MLSTGCSFFFLSLHWVCSSLHVSGLPKGSQRGWLEHVVQLGWVKKKHRMCSRLCAVLSVAVPPAEPCKKLQARFSVPSFLPAVSAHAAAIIGGVQRAEPSASKLFKAPPASCSTLHIVDGSQAGSPPQASSKHPIPFFFLCKPGLGQRGQFSSFRHRDTSGTNCSRRFPLRNLWPLSLSGLLS